MLQQSLSPATCQSAAGESTSPVSLGELESRSRQGEAKALSEGTQGRWPKLSQGHRSRDTRPSLLKASGQGRPSGKAEQGEKELADHSKLEFF